MYSRALMGPVIIYLAFLGQGSGAIIAVLLVVGILTDVFDGIIARRLNVSTQKLRRLDSAVDQLFWFCAIAGTYIMCPAFYKNNMLMLAILLGTELLTYVISFIKFRKEVATHAIASKVWAITIMAALMQVALSCNSTTLFYICFYVGMITRIEIMVILFALKEWSNDVPTFYHAFMLRKGNPIKRNKLFNG